MPRWTTPAIAAGVFAAAALLVAAPLLPVPLAGVLYAAGSLVCHQLPDRSFHLQSFQLPVCARCLGLYGGGVMGSAMAAAVPLRWSGVRLPATGAAARYWLTAIAALPTLVTFALEWGAGWRVSNVARAAAATPLGLAVAFVVVAALATLHYDRCTPQRPPGHDRSPHPRI